MDSLVVKQVIYVYCGFDRRGFICMIEIVDLSIFYCSPLATNVFKIGIPYGRLSGIVEGLVDLLSVECDWVE